MHSKPATKNLFELFVSEISGLTSCVGQLHEASRSLLNSSQKYPAVHRLIEELTNVIKSNQTAFIDAVQREGLRPAKLPDDTTSTLLDLLHADFNEAQREPESVVCTRITSTLRYVTSYFITRISDATESAHLIGATRLQLTLRRWNIDWHVYHAQLCQRSTHFRSHAYVADLDHTSRETTEEADYPEPELFAPSPSSIPQQSVA